MCYTVGEIRNTSALSEKKFSFSRANIAVFAPILKM